MRKLGLSLILLLLASSAFAGDGRILRAQSKPIPGRYIVQFAPGYNVRATARELALGQTARVLYVYEHVLRGAAFEMNEHQALAMSRHPKVVLVEEDVEMWPVGTQTNPPSWGLDRVDQRNLPLDANHTWDFDGTGVNVYVIDTGIRFTHAEFGGRAFLGADFIGDGQNGNDCRGHGTHVAGTIGGATFGVAKNVRLYSVRVFACSGSSPNTVIIAGIDWVTANRVLPAVANASLSGGMSDSLDKAVNDSVASGVFYAVAAGNGNGSDACYNSPARAASAYTVGATTQSDEVAVFSSVGSCIKVFAPGSSITSAWYTSDTATNTISGTSMATPHVAGAAAILLNGNPSLTPVQVASTLTDRATVGVLTNIGSGSPNRLLYTRLPPLTARFTFTCSVLTCSFNASGSTSDLGIASYSWSFGDSTSSAGSTPAHTYPISGQYPVTLTVTDTAGQSASTSQNLLLVFADVPLDHWARKFIEAIYYQGVTAGCGANPLVYCPDATLTRAGAAVFLLRSKLGGNYVPPPATCNPLRFADVPCDYWAAAWIEDLANRGITAGCGSGNYCPEGFVDRSQAAVLLLTTLMGAGYVPPPANCNAPLFSDVPCTHWAAAWIEELARRGITVGCGIGIYCPADLVSRASMAVFLVRTFNFSTADKDARVLSQSVPSTMVPGQSYTVSMTLKNWGARTWNPVGPQCGAFRQGTANSNTWGVGGGGRVELPGAVEPGQQVTLNFTVTAPTTPGTYNFQWRMVHECVEWFGDASPIVAVTVATPPTARFTFACTQLSCSFDASSSTDDVGITSYSWSFGDSTSGSGAAASHPFGATGAYTVTLTVTDTQGLQSSTSKKVSVNSAAPLPAEGFFPVSPCRLVDTRNTTPLTHGQIRVFNVSGSCGVPSTAKAVSLNATVVSPTGGGNLVFYPGDQTSSPLVSSLINFASATSPRANNAVLRLATNGAGTVAVLPSVFQGSPAQVHLILDVDGYFSEDPGGLGYQTLPLCQLHDTNTSTPVTSGVIRSFDSDGLCGIPAGAPGAALNLTSVAPTEGGFATLFQSGIPVPSTSTINFMTGTLALANGARTRLAGAGQDVSLRYLASAGATTRVILDTYGYFASGAPLKYRPITPCRVVDTRFAESGGPILTAGQVRNFQIQGNCGVPVGAKAAMLNIVAITPSGQGNLMSYASGASVPASILSFHPSQGNLANGTIVPLSTSADDLSLLANVSSTHVIVDVFGYFQ
jgi:PKD repeat protein